MKNKKEIAWEEFQLNLLHQNPDRIKYPYIEYEFEPGIFMHSLTMMLVIPKEYLKSINKTYRNRRR